MNEFARTLRNSARFETVTTGADIRYYENGWRLEKWVEAKLNRNELWAFWWLELGPRDDGWIVESSLGICPDVLTVSLEDRYAATPEELKDCLTAALAELTSALKTNERFAFEVDTQLEERQ